MANSVKTYIDVDLTANNNFDFVRAVQGDNSSRYAYVYVLENQQPYITSENKDSVVPVLEGTKPDGTTILNEESIVEEEGNYYIAVEITEQMTAVSGIGKFEISLYTSSTGTTTYDTRLTSFPFKLFVSESAFDISVTSTDEWQSLTEALSHVAEIRIIRTEVEEYADSAAVSESNAAESENNAKVSETNAKESEVNSKTSETNAKESETNSKTSETNAKESETNSKTSETNAKESETLSESWAVGGTSSREGEDENNSKYWSEQSDTYQQSSKSWAIGENEDGTREAGTQDLNQSSYFYAKKSEKYYDDIKGEIGGVALHFRGVYSDSETYQLYDVVSYSGNSYMYINADASSGHKPDTTVVVDDYWQTLAQGASGSEIIKDTEPDPDEQAVGGFWDLTID